MLDHLLLMLFPAAMAFAGAMDLLTMTIPNRVSLLLVAAFVVTAAAFGLSSEAIMMHALAGGIVLVAGFILFAVGGIGGGDAKLLAAAALWIGMDQLVMFLGYVTIFGGLLAMAVLMYRRMPHLGTHAPAWALNLHRTGGGIPYGMAIAASALMIFPKTTLFVAALA